MNKKGFTFMELLIAIIILAIIIIIAVPNVTRVSNSVKEKTRKNLINRIEIAASKYAFDTGKTSVYVDDLIKGGYLEGDDDTDVIHDPVNNNSMNCYKIEMVKNGNYYNATFKDKNNMQNGICNKV